MDFTVSIATLQVALKILANTTASGTDINSHYTFRILPGGKVEALSSNGRTFTSLTLDTESAMLDPVTVPTPFFTVEAKRLHCLLGSLGKKGSVTFKPAGGEVEIITDRGSNQFASLDPALFPYWDETFSTAIETATILASRIRSAYQHARNYVYDEDGKSPNICVTEFRNGGLLSTDQMAVSTIKVQGMDQCNLRVHGKDLGPLVQFLGFDPAIDVSIRESDRASFIVRPDGAVFGVTKPTAEFPKIGVTWDVTDDYTYEVFREEVQGNITFLASGARWDDSTVRLDPASDGKSISMSMSSVAGKPISQRLAVQKYQTSDKPLALPEGGFPVSHPYLIRTLEAHSTNAVKLGVTRRNTGGWIRVRDDRDGDIYITTIAWTKKAS